MVISKPNTPEDSLPTPLTHIRQGTSEENPCLYPGRSFPLPVPPLRVQRTGTLLSPSCKSSRSPRGCTGDYCDLSGSTCTDPSPAVSQLPPDPAGPYLPWRCPGPAAAVPSPSLARRSARECPGSARIAGTGKWKPKLIGAAAAGGGTGGIPDTWEPGAGKL